MRTHLSVVLAALLIATAFAPAVLGGAVGATQAQADTEYHIEMTDATGETITIDDPPERVVALQPSDARTVYEIGAEDSLVGMPINEYTDDLDAGDRTNIAVEDEMSIDAEAVIDLEADLILAANTTVDGDIDQLRDAGETVYHFDSADSIEDVRESVEVTGQLVDESDGATATLEWMDERVSLLESGVEDEEHPLTFWDLGFGWTAGAETFQDELMTTAGTVNLASNVGIDGWAEIDNEVIVDEDPEWILYGMDDPEAEPTLTEGAMETTAYENDNVVGVDSNAINQPAPHVVYALEQIVEGVHGDAYATIEADLMALDEKYAAGEFLPEEDVESGDDEADDSGTDDDGQADDGTSDEQADDETGDDSASDDSDDSMAGFGIPVAVAALLSVLGVGLRLRG